MLALVVEVAEGEVVVDQGMVLGGDPALDLGMARQVDLLVEQVLVEAVAAEVVGADKMVGLDMVLDPVLGMARLVDMVLMVEHMLTRVVKVVAVAADRVVRAAVDMGAAQEVGLDMPAVVVTRKSYAHDERALTFNPPYNTIINMFQVCYVGK